METARISTRSHLQSALYRMLTHGVRPVSNPCPSMPINASRLEVYKIPKTINRSIIYAKTTSVSSSKTLDVMATAKTTSVSSSKTVDVMATPKTTSVSSSKTLDVSATAVVPQTLFSSVTGKIKPQ